MSQWVTLMDFTEAPIGLFVDQGVLYRMFREYCPPASRLSDPPTEFDRSMFARYRDLQYSIPIHQSISRASEIDGNRMLDSMRLQRYADILDGR